jgi:subtilisin family serine protease
MFIKDIPVQKQVRANYAKRYWQELTLQDNLSASQYANKVTSLKQSRNNTIVSPFFTNQSGEKIGLSNFFYVKLKSLSDTVILKQQAINYNAVVVDQDAFMPFWFVLSVTANSVNNALELSNIFYESELFQCAEPDLMIDDKLNCVNDQYFANQWGLKNTGQNGGASGIDIKACDAWQTSTGNNTVVAIIDQGVDLTHPDLVANIFPQSYDSESNTSPSKVLGDHGTACAGIIGAVRNNSVGIAGIAPDCQLMSISNSFIIANLKSTNYASKKYTFF